MNDAKKMKAPLEPAVRYASKLFVKLHNEGERDWVVRSSLPLPEVDGPLDQVNFADLVNTLKIMCNLEPRSYAKPVAGRIELDIKGKPHVAGIHFEDQVHQPFCRITLTPKLS